MSIKNWNAGIIRPVAVAPTGSFQNSAAPGVWTLDQQAYWAKQGIWPTAGNINPNAFIENLFSTYLYTGTGAAQTITNGIDLAGKGGLVWTKRRNVGQSHALYDTLRGTDTYLISNSISFAAFSPGGITSFNANGFSLGSNTVPNTNGGTYASWTFRKQPKFFDVVTYTGTGAVQTINHSLNGTVGMLIIKKTSDNGNWVTFARVSGAAGSTNYAYFSCTGGLNSELAADVASAGAEAAGNITTTGFKPNDLSCSGDGGLFDINALGNTYVAYLFAHDAGGFGLSGTENVISCGRYTTDGSGNATVNLGYEPQWLLRKRSDSISDWIIVDNIRGWAPGNTNTLAANTSSQEFGGGFANQITSTGFSVSDAASRTYIYMAIRRGPMAVPALGTTVFSTSISSSTTANITSGFVTDSVLALDRAGGGSGYGRNVYSRLQGDFRSMNTSRTDSESTFTNSSTISFGQNNGIKLNGGSVYSTAWVYEQFKRAPGFFDEVCYTGTGVNRTVVHNLAVAPELMITKSRSDTYDWAVYAAGIGNTSYGLLNDAGQFYVDSSAWNNTSPTSSVFTVGTGTYMNGSGATYVAYLFATCAGVSKVGSYTGTGTTQAIACGFTTGARYVLIKRTDSTGDWYVWDSARGIVAGNDPYLLLNTEDAEVTNTDYIDTSAAGFEISSTAPAAINAVGGSYIFLAIS